MSTPDALYAVDGPVATLTFDRPAARNAMTWGMYDTLLEACDAVDADPAVKVLILRGAGDRAFVAGTDISQFHDLRTPDDALGYESRLDRVIDRLERVKIPTIARVQGVAVGGGCVMAIACDLRICGPRARFGIPVARTLGNCLSAGNCARLMDIMGAARLKDMMYTARLFDARESLAAGLATQVVDDDRLDAVVAETAATIAANAPLTVRATKEIVRRLQRERRPDPALAHDLIIDCYTSDDFQRAVESFVARRAPVWAGR